MVRSAGQKDGGEGRIGLRVLKRPPCLIHRR